MIVLNISLTLAIVALVAALVVARREVSELRAIRRDATDRIARLMKANNELRAEQELLLGARKEAEA